MILDYSFKLLLLFDMKSLQENRGPAAHQAQRSVHIFWLRACAYGGLSEGGCAPLKR